MGCATGASSRHSRTKSKTHPMTNLLEQAIKLVEQLPPDEQNSIASLILAELADDDRWTAAFAGTQDELSQLVE